MRRLRELIDALEQVAPSRLALSFDRIGLQLGNPESTVDNVAVALDPSEALADFADQIGAQAVITHHPAIWEPLKSLTPSSPNGRFLMRLASRGMAAIAAHTNWDAAPHGINDTLADRLGLREIQPFGEGATYEELKLVTFAPPEALERLLDALSQAGAGQIGLYERCAFLGQGTGTFRPLAGAEPTIGEIGRVEEVPEVRLEMRVPPKRLAAALKALRQAHPYEEPAYDVVPLKGEPQTALGRIGVLPDGLPLEQLVQHVDGRLSTRSLAWGSPEKRVRRVAVVGGAGDDQWIAAQRAGADVLVTGEVKHHVGLAASQGGMCLIQSGHYATEQPGMETLAELLGRRLPDVGFRVFEPVSGSSGRPS